MSKYFTDVITTKRVYHWEEIRNTIREYLDNNLISGVKYRLAGAYFDEWGHSAIRVHLEMYCPCTQNWQYMQEIFISDGSWDYFCDGMKTFLEVDSFGVPEWYYREEKINNGKQ